MEQFLSELKSQLKSEILHDHISKVLYASDASMYQIEPVAVILPRTKSELVHAIEVTSRHTVPVIARGAATNVTGSCLGRGCIIDCSRHLNRIVEINYLERYAVVQPGVVLDHLNEVIAPHGLRVGPDTSTSNRATIGGMAATNASGSYSLRFGSMQDHVLEIELVLWDGEVVRFGPLTKEQHKKKLIEGGTEGKIYRALEHIRKEYEHDIREKFPKFKRRASGYNINVLINDDINIAPLICGSEGSLGIISELKIVLCPKHQATKLVVIGASSMHAILEKITELLHFSPLALELIDSHIIKAGITHPAMRSKLDWLEDQNCQALIVMECEKDAESIVDLVTTWPFLSFVQVISDATLQQHVWELRKSGLGLLLSKRSYAKGLAFIEDVAVPPPVLPAFVSELQALLTNMGKEAGIYGHIGAGCVHVRPYFDLRDKHDAASVEALMDSVKALIKKYEGVLSSEHGDGLVRSWTTPEMFEPLIYEVFRKVKHAFDPYNLMNPGKIVDCESKLLDNLRLSQSTATHELHTYFDFTKDGGFSLAVDMCNGNGQCRKKEGTMCPSFQVTHDEKDSTRARANILRDLIHGKVGHKELYDEHFAKVMELCIMCKGCKTECPSQIDMAKMKAEYLHLYHKKRKRSLRDWLFGHIGTLFSWGARCGWPARVLQTSWLVRTWLSWQGVAADRALPQLAKKRFSRLFAEGPKKETKEVVLFVDTFTEFVQPELGCKAAKILQALGYHVIAPEWRCCGRTLISKGYLEEAREKLSYLVESLYKYAKKGIPIVGLEPSCLLTLVDEVHALHLDEEKVQTVSAKSLLLDTFLAEHADLLAEKCTPASCNLLVHGHCHQKSLVGMSAQLALLRRLTTGSVTEIPSGCCGMAGSFGHESEHAAISKKIGELVLFPYIRAADPDTCIITSGISCRSQIDDVMGLRAFHPIEFIASCLAH